MSANTAAGVARAPIPAYRNVAMSRSPGCRIPPLPLRQRPRSLHALLRLPGDMRSGPLERRPGLVHRYGMDGRGWIGRHGFWPLALLWLPAGIAAQAAVRFGPDALAAGAPGPWLATMAVEGLSLAALVPCGLPLALGCRRLWRLGYRRAPGSRESRSARRRWWRRCRPGCSGRSRSRSAPWPSARRCGWPGGGSRGGADRRRCRAGCAAVRSMDSL